MRAIWAGLGVVAAASAVVFAAPTDKGPQPEDPAQHAAKIELGRRLFFEPMVSRGGRVSCGSCHDPAHGFTDTAHPSTDEWGTARRRTMPLSDLGDGPFHSDGEFPSVRNLLDARIAPLPLLRQLVREEGRRVKLAGDEASFPTSYGASKADPPALVRVVDRLVASGLYATAFREAFGETTPTHERVCEAVEAYVRSLRTSTNGLDRFLGGDDAALSAPAAHGLAVFTGKAGCANCHDVRAVDGRAPLRDGKFHNTGVSSRTAAAPGRPDGAGADVGLAEHAANAADRRRDAMKFKTPSLRDVAKRGPFMHDGSLATLADVVDFYSRKAAPDDADDPLLKRIDLTPQDKDDLVAFLLALSGDDRPGLVAAPAGPRTLRVRVVDPSGRPLAGTAFEVEAAGDRFRDAAPSVHAIQTDKDGRATCDFPVATHARLRSDRFVVATLVPDCAGEAEVVAVPVTQVALRVRAAPKMLPGSVRATPIEKKNAKGQVIEDRDGDTVVFEFARKLSDVEGIYVAKAPAGGAAASRRFLSPNDSAGGALPAVVDVDLSGGATSGVDLTPLAHANDAK